MYADALIANATASLDLFSEQILAALTAPSCPAAVIECAPAPAAPQPHGNYVIPADAAIGTGGSKARFRQNVVAIKLLRMLQDAGRHATDDEKAVLVRYVGWGGIPQAFRHPDGSMTTGWEGEVAELETLLRTDELADARRSTQDSHYTSRIIIDAIYAGLARMGFTGGRVLEPAVGIGHFIGLAHAAMRSSMQWTAIELDPISAGITRALYPDARTVNDGFENVYVPRGTFDLAIGNPPFGSQPVHDSENRDLGAFSIHSFFFAKSIRALRAGGLLAMVVTQALMDKPCSAERAWLAERAHLVGAIRLPNTAFKDNAGTDVTCDVLFLKKAKRADAGCLGLE
ncbi:DNA methylase [mine drainage metagenome]|uniref:DNA methylase n=1 Tax=mine drainage metagenome TaxID=410659 RepID=T0ZT95_9ZZZZ